MLALLESSGPEEDAALGDFLEKVLAAAGIRLSTDVLLIRLTKGEPFSFSQLSRRHGIRQVLIFGIEPGLLGLHFQLPLYQPVQLGPTTFLLAHNLADIHQERQQGGKEKAGLLWKALQILFPKS